MILFDILSIDIFSGYRNNSCLNNWVYDIQILTELQQHYLCISVGQARIPLSRNEALNILLKIRLILGQDHQMFKVYRYLLNLEYMLMR